MYSTFFQFQLQMLKPLFVTSKPWPSIMMIQVYLQFNIPAHIHTVHTWKNLLLKCSVMNTIKFQNAAEVSIFIAAV